MSWKNVCSLNDLESNSLREFDVDGISIVLARVDDQVRAIPPACPHMEEPLARSGLCSGGMLTCTKHLWQWDILTGEERGDAEKPLLMYETKVEDDNVLVFVDGELEYEYDDEDDEDDDD